MQVNASFTITERALNPVGAKACDKSTARAPVYRLLNPSNRLTRFLFRLLWGNSNVLQQAIVHLHQLGPLPIALTGQSTDCDQADSGTER